MLRSDGQVNLSAKSVLAASSITPMQDSAIFPHVDIDHADHFTEHDMQGLSGQSE